MGFDKNAIERQKMINALKNLKEAFGEVAEIWDSSEIGAQFDETLEKSYPFDSCFYDIQFLVAKWTEESIEELKSK